MANWADLPHHLVDVIMDMIDSLDNLTFFGSVCSSWRQAYIQNLERRLQILKSPLLMINNNPPLPHVVEEEEEEKEGKQVLEQDKKNVEEAPGRRVYSVATNNILNFRLPVHDIMFCVGSSNGWLVTVPTHDDNVIYPVALLNPFLSPPNNEIQLPSLQMLPQLPSVQMLKSLPPNLLPPDIRFPDDDVVIDRWFTLKKAVVSVNPATNVDYTVMVIFGDTSELAFWKPGDTRWTPVQTEWIAWYFVNDVIFYGHQFFSVNHYGVLACDVSDPEHQKFREIESLAPGLKTPAKKYVVESLGYLFEVYRSIEKHNPDYKTYWTKNFQVFKMDCQIEQWNKEGEGFKPGWIEVNSLDDRAFFIGHNASISRSAAEVPGLKPNCIYFTDDCFAIYFATDKTIGTYDMGVYSLEDKRFERYNNYPMVPNGAPIWVDPTLGELKTLLKQI